MTKLLQFDGQTCALAQDDYVRIEDGEALPPQGAVILSLARFEAEGDALLSEGRKVGVFLRADEAVEALAYDLPRIPLVALDFPKYRDGRAYSSAVVLRQRFAYRGEVRAVGDVLVDQAWNLVRCGFSTFETAASPAAFASAIHRFRHVYQASADHRTPVFAQRGA